MVQAELGTESSQEMSGCVGMKKYSGARKTLKVRGVLRGLTACMTGWLVCKGIQGFQSNSNSSSTSGGGRANDI